MQSEIYKPIIFAFPASPSVNLLRWTIGCTLPTTSGLSHNPPALIPQNLNLPLANPLRILGLIHRQPSYLSSTMSRSQCIQLQRTQPAGLQRKIGPNAKQISNSFTIMRIRSSKRSNTLWRADMASQQRQYLALHSELKHLIIGREKMYKTRIKQWGLDKKNKEPEMRAIVRKHKQRTDQGKTSTILVRGQIRTIVEAFRYWGRKGVSMDEIIARQRASPTPETVTFFTPVPSPIPTPQALATPERMFRSIRDYIRGSFESRLWFSENPRCVCRSIKDEDKARNDWVEFVTECRPAHHCLGGTHPTRQNEP